MTDTRKAQLEVGSDAGGVLRALGSIGDTAQDSATKVEQAGARMATSLDDLPAASDAASKKVARDTDTMIASIQRATAAANAGGRGTAAYYQQLATDRGLDVTKITPYLDELAKAQSATQSVAAAAATVAPGLTTAQAAAQALATASTGISKELDHGGMSAKAFAAAMREVPPQITDIVVGLQSGQKPLTVLFQQGGQLKDMFGGVGNAASAVGRYLLSLLNPLSLTAAGLAAIAYAYNEGSKEAEAFNRTLILSGSAAGETTGQLVRSAAALRDMGVATQGRAAEVLNEMAQSAGIGADNTERFAAAALKLQRAGGPAAEATIQAFKDLAKAPLDASAKLNEQYNYLTPAVYEQIRALTELGKTSDAARVAQEAYATAMSSRSVQLEQSLGFLERAWRAVADTAKGAWDKMLGIGRSDTASPEQIVSGLQSRIAKLQTQLAQPDGTDPTGAEKRARADAEALLGRLQAQLVVQQSKAAAGQQEAQDKAKTLEATKALAALDQVSDQYLPRRLQMEKELAQVRENAAKALAAPNLDENTRNKILTEQKAAEHGIREKYDPGFDQVQAQADLATIQRQLGLINDAYANADRVLEAQRAAGLEADGTYYAKKAALIERDRQSTVESLQAEIDATTKASTSDKLTTEQRQANAQKVLDLQADISKANSKAATDATVLAQSQASALRTVAVAYDEARTAAQNYLNDLQRDETRELARAPLGAAEQQRLQGRDQLTNSFESTRRNYQQQLARLPKDADGNVNPDQQKNLENLIALQDTFEKASLSTYDAYTAKKMALDADWTNGAKKAWADWAENTANVAAEASKVLTMTMDGIADSITNAATKGKLSFSSMLQSIETEIVNFGAKIAVQKGLTALAQWAGIGGAPGAGGAAPAAGGSGAGAAISGGAGTLVSFGVGALASTIGDIYHLMTAGFGGGFFAKGGAFSAGSGLEAYRNSVVTVPTPFKFAQGYAPNMGLMGEKPNSPGEAIVPLVRTRGGDLGVKMVGQQTARQVITNQTFVVPGAIDRRTQSQVAIATYGAAQRAARRS